MSSKQSPTALATFALSALLFYGGFSRITSGRYTPALYAYQEDRHANDTILIPLCDVGLASLLLHPRTRTVAAGSVMATMGIGLGMRLSAGKDGSTDAAMLAFAAAVFILNLRVRGNQGVV